MKIGSTVNCIGAKNFPWELQPRDLGRNPQVGSRLQTICGI